LSNPEISEQCIMLEKSKKLLQSLFHRRQKTSKHQVGGVEEVQKKLVPLDVTSMHTFSASSTSSCYQNLIQSAQFAVT
jgi:hypothetical protein